ncbi:hypothetical protein JZ751_021092 [Albula glossodonta]|uniref:Lon proteolytic domain-containing protein n=1 Tax=Albula glossodonta TaxID=121402 RepID=A0A8T2PNQ5_9TELE|nr:hypothetical protein JZ751_021092 [Albula glossodonta]
MRIAAAIIGSELRKILRDGYTREAGVRSLERKFGAICRAVAVKVAEGHKAAKPEAPPPEPPQAHSESEAPELEGQREESLGGSADLALPPEMPIVLDRHALKDILGPPLFEMESQTPHLFSMQTEEGGSSPIIPGAHSGSHLLNAGPSIPLLRRAVSPYSSQTAFQVSERLTLPGVAIGLAWTPLGGEIMFVEASRMEGEGQLTLTGQLGDGTDIHLHFPAGAVTKDGPSAGVTMVTCLASLFSGRLVRSDVAMTGEITLRGLVLPVGGIKDKVLAAHRAGLKRVILPKRNEKDLEEIPLHVRAELDFVLAGSLDEILNAAFDGGFPTTQEPFVHPQITSKL